MKYLNGYRVYDIPCEEQPEPPWHDILLDDAGFDMPGLNSGVYVELEPHRARSTTECKVLAKQMIALELMLEPAEWRVTWYLVEHVAMNE